jgi:hypothetical protein
MLIPSSTSGDLNTTTAASPNRHNVVIARADAARSVAPSTNLITTSALGQFRSWDFAPWDHARDARKTCSNQLEFSSFLAV